MNEGANGTLNYCSKFPGKVVLSHYPFVLFRIIISILFLCGFRLNYTKKIFHILEDLQMTTIQEGDREKIKPHCNKHKCLSSVYFSKRFSKKEDNSCTKQLGKFHILGSNLHQCNFKTKRYYTVQLNVEISYYFRIEARSIKSM